MANPHRGDVEILDVAGKSFTLQFNIDAFCALEEKVGKPYQVLAVEVAYPETMTVTLVRAMLWAGLREHHADLTLKEVGERFIGDPGGGLQRVLPPLSKAIERAFPKAAEGNPTPPGQ